jgi:hypothetical protein
MRPKTPFAAAFLLAGVCLAAGSGQIESKLAPRDASADTDPDSAFWRGVQPIYAERDNSGDPVPGHRTEIRSRWTAGNLYFLFICPYESLSLKPEPKIETETNELWKWDVAEVFIGTDFKNIRRYKEFEISPQSEWIDLDINLDSPRREDGWLWNSGLQAAARIDAASKIWYAFMRIPYQSVDSRPAASGNIFRINFFRSQGPRPNHKSILWQPTHKPSFHVPEVFGTLKLVD